MTGCAGSTKDRVPIVMKQSIRGLTAFRNAHGSSSKFPVSAVGDLSAWAVAKRQPSALPSYKWGGSRLQNWLAFSALLKESTQKSE